MNSFLIPGPITRWWLFLPLFLWCTAYYQAHFRSKIDFSEVKYCAPCLCEKEPICRYVT